MELQSGKNFDDVALKFSADPSVAQNKGNLGYITVFSLPYQFENVIYNLSPGKFSTPYRSNSGYHIFKKLGKEKQLAELRFHKFLLLFLLAAIHLQKATCRISRFYL